MNCIPPRCLVMLIGTSASGKSTFAQKYFKPSEVVSSDYCRLLVCDDASSQDYNEQAFKVFHKIIKQRLSIGKLTVADATNLRGASRDALFEIAEKYGIPVVGILFNTDPGEARFYNTQRDRVVPEHVIMKHAKQLKSAKSEILRDSRFAAIYETDERGDLIITISDGISAPGWDVIGDVHGVFTELVDLLEKLGYRFDVVREQWYHPDGRKLVFVGDITDRGPSNAACLGFVYKLVKAGLAFSVQGNHCNKLARWIKGNKISIAHGLSLTIAELEQLPKERVADYGRFLESTPCILRLNVEGHPRLIVTHAGICPELVNNPDRKIKERCLYGLVKPGKLEDGSPNRDHSWVEKWKAVEDMFLVYGHTRHDEPQWHGNSVNIDTGAVHGGHLTALRYPEREIVQIKARRKYASVGPDL